MVNSDYFLPANIFYRLFFHNISEIIFLLNFAIIIPFSVSTIKLTITTKRKCMKTFQMTTHWNLSGEWFLLSQPEKKSNAEECIFNYIAFHMECQSNQNKLLRGYFLPFLPAKICSIISIKLIINTHDQESSKTERDFFPAWCTFFGFFFGEMFLRNFKSLLNFRFFVSDFFVQLRWTFGIVQIW